jgi:hypothetical protein
MSNVLSEEKKQQVIALGKLGWSLRRIEEATGVRRETASAYLRTAGVEVCLPGWGRRAPAKAAIQPTPDPESKPAIQVTPDFNAAFSRKPPVPSSCEPYRERIEEGLVKSSGFHMFKAGPVPGAPSSTPLRLGSQSRSGSRVRRYTSVGSQSACH